MRIATYICAVSCKAMSAIIPKVSELTPRIIRILGCNPGPMTLQGTNTYLIGTGKRRILLDVGEKGNGEYISSLMSVLQKHGTSIDKILISHWHHDHIGGLQDVLNSSKDVTSVYKFPRFDPPDDPLPEVVNMKSLVHRQEVAVEGATVRVHHTPGHTTDHVILELSEEGAVFSGDCILGEGTAVFEDLHTYMASLKDILELEPKVIYPGHGPVIEDPLIRIQHYIDHRNQRERQILAVLKDSTKKYLTPMELVKIIYKETPEILHPAAAVNVGHQLDKLFKDGLIHGHKEAWCLKSRKDQL